MPLSKSIKGNWVYKLTVEEVSLIFEANYRKCFGILIARNLNQFIQEYNQLFNHQNNNLGNDFLRLRLYTKHLKLLAIYDSLLYAQGENALKEFKTMFGEDYKKPEQLKFVTDENMRILDKLRMLQPFEKKNGKSLSFGDLLLLVETSRGMAIDRKMKLWEFKKMYDLELKKWQTQK